MSWTRAARLASSLWLSSPSPVLKALHRRTIRVLCLDPIAGPAGRPGDEHGILNRELISQPLLFFTSGTPCGHVRASSVLSVGCPKTATYRSPRFLYVAALVPSAGTILI